MTDRPPVMQRAHTGWLAFLAVLVVAGVLIANRVSGDDGDGGVTAVTPEVAGVADEPSGAGTRPPFRGTAHEVPPEVLASVAPGADLRVNVGGEAYEDASGAVWTTGGCSGEAYTSPNAIAGTGDDVLFQSRRFEPECSWGVPAGRYEVIVGWAETYRDRAGYRVFPLLVEGETVASVDVAGSVGLNQPYLLQVEVDVVDAQLDIAVGKGENRPMIALVVATRIGELPDEPTVSAPTATAPTVTLPAEVDEPERGVNGLTLLVGADQPFATLQDALAEAEPGATIVLTQPGPHEGPAITEVPGEPGAPITITAEDGAWLECGTPDEAEIARCLQVSHAYYRIERFSIQGGSSNLYLVGLEAGDHVHDVTILDSRFRGAPEGGTGECIRVKYQAYAIEIAGNDIAGCGLGKCCGDSKNGEGVYVGTAPEQLEKNPTDEPDATNDVWIHHNRIDSLAECVDMKEATHGILVEYNHCTGQQDSDSGGFGSRGGRVGAGNTIRFNRVQGAQGACVRFGGDVDPDGTGNNFYGNVCEDIDGEHGVKQMRDPQGLVCDNLFLGRQPDELSRDDQVDPTAPCPAGTPEPSSAAP
jgi:hypothetical protein